MLAGKCDGSTCSSHAIDLLTLKACFNDPTDPTLCTGMIKDKIYLRFLVTTWPWQITLFVRLSDITTIWFRPSDNLFLWTFFTCACRGVLFGGAIALYYCAITSAPGHILLASQDTWVANLFTAKNSRKLTYRPRGGEENFRAKYAKKISALDILKSPSCFCFFYFFSSVLSTNDSIQIYSIHLPRNRFRRHDDSVHLLKMWLDRHGYGVLRCERTRVKVI